MVAEARTYVDVTTAVITWTSAALSVPVFSGTNDAAGFPQVTVRRVGGTDEAARIQFDVWGNTRSATEQTAAALATAADALSSFDAGGVRLHGAVVESSRWLPDPDSDRPRFELDVVFTATAL
jgi:hypothetical protein